MTFADILGTGVIAGVVVQLLQAIRDYFSQRSATNKIATGHALKISNQLKMFSLRCGSAIDEFNIQEPTPDPSDQRPPNMPEIDFLTLTAEALEVDKGLLARIVDLDLRRIAEEEHLALAYQLYLDYDERVNADVNRLKYLKKECSEVASLLRSQYGLPEFPDLLDVVVSAACLPPPLLRPAPRGPILSCCRIRWLGHAHRADADGPRCTGRSIARRDHRADDPRDAQPRGCAARARP